MLRVKSKKIIRALAIALAVTFAAAITSVLIPDTAKADTASVKITLDYRQTVARSQLAQINSWRAGSTWYYNSSGSKVYLSGLKALKYDYTLEQYAMQRAAEIALSFEHTRPTGSPRSGLSGYLGTGENIAATTNSQGGTAAYALNMFKEEDKPYRGQGHRRVMLSVPADFDAVGIACVYYKGCYYWAQEFGLTSKPNTTATTAVNGNKTMTVELDTSRLITRSADLSELNNWTAKLNKGQTDYLPDVTLNLGMDESWPYESIPVTAVPTWTSSNTGVATVNSNAGTITGVSAGTTNVTMKESITNSSKTTSVSVTDPNAVTGVTLNKSTLALNTGASATLTATVSPSTATNKNVTWTSSNTSVATVSSSGVVKGVKAGTATITAKTASGSKTATCKVTVSDIVPTGVSLSKSSLTLNTGASSVLTATVSPNNATNKNLTWTSSNSSVATVSNGTVKGLKAGTATITAKTASGGKTSTCAVTVKDVPVTGVLVSPTSTSVTAGATVSLKATVSPSNATNKNVTWTSANTAIATVSSSGVVTGVKEGNTTITVKTRDGSKTATCNVKVEAVPSTYTGLLKTSSGWLYYKNGKFDSTYTGMAKNAYGWWYVKNGKLDQTYEGMAKNAYGWWYLKKGTIDFTYTGMAKNQYGWWYITKGKLDQTFTGMAKNQYGWWYLKKGTIDFTYTGVAKNDYGYWYIVKGALAKSYNGTITFNGKQYKVVNSKVTNYP